MNFNPYRLPVSKQFLFTAIAVIIASALCYSLSPWMGYKITAFVLLVTVSIIAMFFDIIPVLFAAVLSALIWDFFFIPPKFTVMVSNTEDALMLLMYFVIALVNAVLTNKIRQVEKMAREKEEKANSVRLYDAVLSSLSHELRTPIATILGASDNLLNEGDKISTENKEKLVNEIFSASVRLNLQVENLLNMSRLESGFIKPKREWNDINELIYSVINQLEDALKTHSVSVNIKEGLAPVKIDFGLVQQVLYNLINNAALHTPANSIINISADYKNSNLEITIEDNGGGFSNDEMKHVFNKFYRIKGTIGSGTGLGLSIVKGFVEAMDGKVMIKNNNIGGASFIVIIPAETTNLSKLEND